MCTGFPWPRARLETRASARAAMKRMRVLSLDERPGRDVEVLGHRHVHEAADVAQRARDVALAAGVLGEDQVAGPAEVARAFARLELEQAGGEEDELAARRVVQVLHVALRRLAEEQRAALEGLRNGAR